VAEVIQRFHAALASADSATVLALLADDVVVLESGGLESRSEYRAHHLPADIRFTQAVKSKRGLLRVVVSGDVAWAVSTSEVSGVWRDRAIDSAGAELMVLTREVNGWRIRAIHWSSRPKER
jgi:ketosteroid isomerase-like protein